MVVRFVGFMAPDLLTFNYETLRIRNSLLFQILTNYCRIFLWFYCVLREILYKI